MAIGYHYKGSEKNKNKLLESFSSGQGINKGSGDDWGKTLVK